MTDYYDVIIRNSMIVDGTGNPASKGSIGIKGEKIVAVGDVRGDAVREVDGLGFMTCPGFIDPHSHADTTLLRYPLAENLVMQGITTFLGGNCGNSNAPIKNLCPSRLAFAHEWWHEVEPNTPNIPLFIPLDRYNEIITKKLGFSIDWRTFDEWLLKVESTGISVNYAPLVGHNTIREAVMGENFKRTATRSEIKEMKNYVEEAMSSGAFGISTFFDPSPGEYAATEEIIELAKVASKYGGIYFPHRRHVQSQWPSNDPEEYGYGVYHGPIEDVWVGRYRGLLEVIEISRRAKIPLHIVHLESVYRIPQPHPDFLDEAAAKATLWHIDRAIEEGLKVDFDVILSKSSEAGLRPLINEFWKSKNIALKWANQFEKGEFIEKLKIEEFREKIRRVYDEGRLKLGMIHTKAHPYWMDCFKILRCKNIEYEGKTIGEIARSRNIDPLNTIFDILVEDPETIWVQFLNKMGVIFSTHNGRKLSDDRDIRPAIPILLKHPAAMPCTDVAIVPFKRGLYDIPPIAYGMYADYIGRYVREKAFLSLEEAVKKATYLPAKMLRLNRGLISPGTCADIVVFDFKKIGMRGNFLEPAQAPEGIEYVLINGKIVYEQMKHTGAREGKVLRRTAL